MLCCAAASGREDVALCFREVPPIFLRYDFDLRNPDIFNEVLGPGSSNAGAPKLSAGSGSGSGVGQVVSKQEKFSRYLDLVEVALLRQIWSKSNAFFRALDDIKGLQRQVAEAYKRLTALRSRLRLADEGVTTSSMRIPQLYRRQVNEWIMIDINFYLLNLSASMDDHLTKFDLI